MGGDGGVVSGDHHVSVYMMNSLDRACVEGLVGSRVEVWDHGAGNTRTGPIDGVSFASRDGRTASDLHNGYHSHDTDSWRAPPSPAVLRAWCPLEAMHPVVATWRR